MHKIIIYFLNHNKNLVQNTISNFISKNKKSIYLSKAWEFQITKTSISISPHYKSVITVI